MLKMIQLSKQDYYNYIKNYNILTKNSRVKNLYAMILGYKPEGKVNQEMILFGYMDNNVIYTKSEEKE
jgi:CRISPR-associated protein Csh1